MQRLKQMVLGKSVNGHEADEEEVVAKQPEKKEIPEPNYDVFSNPKNVLDRHLHELGQYYLDRFPQSTYSHSHQLIAQNLLDYIAPNKEPRERLLKLVESYVEVRQRGVGEFALDFEKRLSLALGLKKEDFNKSKNELYWFLNAKVNDKFATLAENEKRTTSEVKNDFENLPSPSCAKR